MGGRADLWGLYQPGRSVLHRAPAGMKLLLLVAAAVGTHWLDRPWRVGAGLLGVLALYGVARLPLRVLTAQLRSLAALVLVLAGFQWLVSGWRTAVVVVGVLVLLVLLAGLVTLTTRTTAMIDTVTRLCRPLRRVGVDPERIGLILALGIRSVAVVAGLAHDVREAQLARGLGSSPTAFAVPLVVRSLRHADALGDALVARGVDD
ncbi:energy-coupling factor transporter transmembrane component T family protein [Nocardioides terrisoli]|uniref:energy-coupling factor transporter transmembrane component T family protein n=1 Tax=Nocardioides terrisoli TaxID=3388267 RepID=UPI00287B69E5|nr:energy-coupling factor transporter transmembrane protein EcfT [Nocardioides marmorisolisilvae]